MSKSNIQFKIEHIEALLVGRQEEYSVFGMTEEDRVKDVELRSEILELKKELKPNKEE